MSDIFRKPVAMAKIVTCQCGADVRLPENEAEPAPDLPHAERDEYDAECEEYVLLDPLSPGRRSRHRTMLAVACVRWVERDPT